MISLSLARSLKEAGLVWRAGVNDFFAIPDRGMDDRVFVISDLLANLDVFRGWPVVTFHGSAEWALDYILTTEVVWLPREEQLRQALLDTLKGETLKSLQLTFDGQNYRCTVLLDDETVLVDAPSASAAYGQALLHLLKRRAHEPDS
jgi:hypothetical protein